MFKSRPLLKKRQILPWLYKCGSQLYYCVNHWSSKKSKADFLPVCPEWWPWCTWPAWAGTILWVWTQPRIQYWYPIWKHQILNVANKMLNAAFFTSNWSNEIQNYKNDITWLNWGHTGCFTHVDPFEMQNLGSKKLKKL